MDTNPNPNTSFHDLPPLKRFKLMQYQESSTTTKTPSFSDIDSASPSVLPAKKRKSYSPDSTAYCLPAKKRIWAPKPFDLNLEFDQQSPIQSPKQKPVDPILVNDEDGIVCSVCESTDGDPSDPIVFCDGCDLMVHATCYGYPLTEGIPEGDWFCDKCLASKETSADVCCCLCPNPGGALKATVDEGKWAHLVCAIYVPEVFFSDPEGRRGIDCSKLLKRRWERKCCVCKSKSNGCVIDCSEPKCPLAFHVTCGLNGELCVEYRQGKKGRGDVVVAFCEAHTDLWKKQEQTGKFKIVARDETEKQI